MSRVENTRRSGVKRGTVLYPLILPATNCEENFIFGNSADKDAISSYYCRILHFKSDGVILYLHEQEWGSGIVLALMVYL